MDEGWIGLRKRGKRKKKDDESYSPSPLLFHALGRVSQSDNYRNWALGMQEATRAEGGVMCLLDFDDPGASTSIRTPVWEIWAGSRTAQRELSVCPSVCLSVMQRGVRSGLFTRSFNATEISQLSEEFETALYRTL